MDTMKDQFKKDYKEFNNPKLVTKIHPALLPLGAIAIPILFMFLFLWWLGLAVITLVGMLVKSSTKPRINT